MGLRWWERVVLGAEVAEKREKAVVEEKAVAAAGRGGQEEGEGTVGRRVEGGDEDGRRHSEALRFLPRFPLRSLAALKQPSWMNHGVHKGWITPAMIRQL